MVGEGEWSRRYEERGMVRGGGVVKEIVLPCMTGELSFIKNLCRNRSMKALRQA